MPDTLSPTDERLLRRAIAIAAAARSSGNHPFGAVMSGGDGEILFEAENTVVTGRDVTGHAELNLVRRASGILRTVDLERATLYASTEPCAMCAGAIYWSGIGRVVFALGAETFRQRIGASGGDTLDVPCREVLARGGRPTLVHGPCLESEAWTVHDGFWARGSAGAA
jgi:tRNA(Arg) A34 adenosine deaminase TadA